METPAPLAADYIQFAKAHLPNLFRFVIPIASEDEHGQECIGTGVLIRVANRHFVATAAHCIRRNPRPLRRTFYLDNDRFVSSRPVPIVRVEFHAHLDIGILEIQEPMDSEIDGRQLSTDRIPDGTVHIIGHPVCRIERDKIRREMTVTRCAFGTKIVDQTEDFLKFQYPVEGVQATDDQWVKHLFPATPHGFSGGGCFGVCLTTRQGIQLVEYKLLGIQYEWHPMKRWVNAVPIGRWIELLRERCGISL